MSEPPDFKTLAMEGLKAVQATDPLKEEVHTVYGPVVDQLAEQLRQVWNARGAADIAKLEWAFEGTTPSMKTLDQALRTLDR